MSIMGSDFVRKHRIDKSRKKRVWTQTNTNNRLRIFIEEPQSQKQTDHVQQLQLILRDSCDLHSSVVVIDWHQFMYVHQYHYPQRLCPLSSRWSSNTFVDNVYIKFHCVHIISYCHIHAHIKFHIIVVTNSRSIQSIRRHLFSGIWRLQGRISINYNSIDNTDHFVWNLINSHSQLPENSTDIKVTSRK